MEKMSQEEIESRFTELIQHPPYPVAEMLTLIGACSSGKAEERALALFAALVEAQDFDGAMAVLGVYGESLERRLQADGLRQQLRSATKDRLVLAYIESVGFGVRRFADAFGRLEKLLAFHPGMLVLSAAWGLGEIKRLDGFYRRVTIDFSTRRGHQLTFDAACETLLPAPENHILVIAKADPQRVEKMIKEDAGGFVKAMLSSFGDMPITKLEELSAVYGFVKKDNWKPFWERARTDLRKEKIVDIPTRRTEPLHLKASAETYGDSWFTAFAHMTDPKSILSSVRELESTGRMRELDEAAREKIAERLAFALKGARGTDDALYARVAFCLDEFKLEVKDKEGKSIDLVSKARAYLWENHRFLEAARSLPARDTQTLVAFLLAGADAARKEEFLSTLAEMNFSLLCETLTYYKDDVRARDAQGALSADPAVCCEDVVARLLKDPAAPATLVTFILGRWRFFSHWTQLPPLVVILTHAIALGEGKQSGETLRMQNTIRRLFADKEWLKGIFDQLGAGDQALFFERFQASIAWDPSTHHMIVVRMTTLVPALAARQIKKEKAPEAERITSLRSYAARKAAYEKLVTVEIPQNARDIEFARGYGDLSENFEYQSAKDKERMLIQKQATLQDELNAVKAVDFADVAADCVRPGTTATLEMASGEKKSYTILGEWDNDLEANIISNKTRLAQNMLGKKVGDTVEVSDAQGQLSTARLAAVDTLSDAVRAWIAATEVN